jgi:phage terminase Nu1 subunit (DNA packaging protein)
MADQKIVSLSKRDFAKRHSVSPRTVDHWRHEGMPSMMFGTRKVLIPVDLADAWVRKRFLRADPKTIRSLNSMIATEVPNA